MKAVLFHLPSFSQCVHVSEALEVSDVSMLICATLVRPWLHLGLLLAISGFKIFFHFLLKNSFFSILNLQLCIFSPAFVSSSPKCHSALAEFGSCRVSAAPCRWDEAVKGCQRPPRPHPPPPFLCRFQALSSC